MSVPESYFDTSGWDRAARLSGGSQRIPISTPAGDFQVWTRRVGNNPSLKVLLLHGGPGGSSEWFEPFDVWFPRAGIEYYHYDQLGSFRSDKPDDPSLWTIDRFVDEVEQVRLALGLDSSNFVLFGHSWGGLLAIEYALAHPQNLKGMIVANMVSSGRACQRYLDEVIKPSMDQGVLAEMTELESQGRTEDPRYGALFMQHVGRVHGVRLGPGPRPDSHVRAVSHINWTIYHQIQGPSELTSDPEAELAQWDRSEDLGGITVPSLTVGATYDTMDPAHMEWMADQLPNGNHLRCSGGHSPHYDDQENYFPGLINFLQAL
jgi:proline iminopeptidase